MDRLPPRPTKVPENSPAERAIIRLALIGTTAWAAAETADVLNNKTLEIAGKVIAAAAIGVMVAVTFVDSRIHRRDARNSGQQSNLE